MIKVRILHVSFYNKPLCWLNLKQNGGNVLHFNSCVLHVSNSLNNLKSAHELCRGKKVHSVPPCTCHAHPRVLLFAQLFVCSYAPLIIVSSVS